MTPTAATAAAAGAGARPVPNLSKADFDFLRALVRERSAIVLDEGKEYLVESRLAPILRSEGMKSIAELVQAVRLRRPGLEAKIVDAMTTNETSFFRDVHPFEAFRTALLPVLVERRRTSRELNFWCAAASSGQEPYSFAMVVREHFPELSGWKVNFLATDISPSMIEKAKSGRYTQLEVNRGLPASYLVKYFDRHGAEFVLKQEIRNMVEFRLLNLADQWPMMAQMDVVFIRNVLIYFDRETKRKVLQGIRRLLRPGGYVMLGSSETTFNIDDGWASKSFGKTICYQSS